MAATTRLALASVGLFAALTFVGSPASGERRHRDRDGGADEREDRASSPEKASPHEGAAREEADKESDDDDAAAPVVVNRSPEQRDRRDKLVAKERELLRSEVRRDPAHRLVPRERQAIGLHWRHVMRLARIRELAEQDGDKAVVASVDTLMDRADKKFVARMDELLAEGERTDAGKR